MSSQTNIFQQQCLEGLDNKQRAFAEDRIATFEQLGVAIPYAMIRVAALEFSDNDELGEMMR